MTSSAPTAAMVPVHHPATRDTATIATGLQAQFRRAVGRALNTTNPSRRLLSMSDLLEISEPTVGFIGPMRHRIQARDWALVLQSQSIGYRLQAVKSGWVLRVAREDVARATRAIETYVVENRNWPPTRQKDTPRHEPSLVVPFVFALLSWFFGMVTGPGRAGSEWFTQGRADALQLFEQPWRMVTALTLHGDTSHILGNAISGSIFGVLLSRRVGPGGALLALVVGGTIGNSVNAWAHLPHGHLSIGASTAIFSAVGMLAALQAVRNFGLKGAQKQKTRPTRPMDWVAPIVGGLTLLGTLGSGTGNTDLWAHGFGFLAGLAVGGVMGAAIERSERARQSKGNREAWRPSLLWQLGAGFLALGTVGGSWLAAFYL